jgi:phytoene dehydrogenase-like protein
MYRLLRWGPMAVADLVAEYFETELLRATIAARGIFGTFLGPRSAGSSLVLLIRAAGDEHAAGTSWFASGGMGAVTQAMAAAAQQAGAEIRNGAEVIEVRVKDGIASGVVLSNGEEITAGAVISNADPKRTLLKLVDPAQLSPDFVMKLQHYRMPGTVAKVNLALAALPKFTALAGENHDRALSSRIHIGPEIDYLGAPSANQVWQFFRQPYLQSQSIAHRSLACTGQTCDVDLHAIRSLQVEGSDWEKQRVPLSDTMVKTLAQYAPNLPNDLESQIVTPQDLEETTASPGDIFLCFRWISSSPCVRFGLGALSHADSEPLPVRLRHPSRRGIDRRFGSQRSPRNIERPQEITHEGAPSKLRLGGEFLL